MLWRCATTASSVANRSPSNRSLSSDGGDRTLADPLRTTLLELLLERAASVTEMALAVDRPKSTSPTT